jgi:hypothetical protein
MNRKILWMVVGLLAAERIRESKIDPLSVKRTCSDLYMKLPRIYRQRDECNSNVLREILDILEKQVQSVEKDIEKLYGEYFIESADEWEVPYIGDMTVKKRKKSR